jgi:hypothetical protein
VCVCVCVCVLCVVCLCVSVFGTSKGHRKSATKISELYVIFDFCPPIY